MMPQDHQLIILWENARRLEKDILLDIKNKFHVLKEYEIQWDEDKFRFNLGSFYSEDFEFDSYQEKIRGKGAFLAILVEDLDPIYKDGINQNTFSLKHKWRDILGSFTVHATDNIKQTKHDICLLTGKSLSDILKSEKLDGERVYLHQNLPCVDGWKNLEQIFYVLNETVNYVVLRPDKINPKTHKMSLNGDIDILTDDFFSISAVLNACKNVNNNAFKFFNWTKHAQDDTELLIHPKFVGDNYYDKKWQEKLLKNKIQDQNGIYFLQEKDLFWTLLYHGLIHKENYQKYNDLLINIASKYNIVYKNDKKYLIELLYQYLKSNKYKIALHLDNVAGHLVSDNVYKKLLKEKPTLYYYSRGELGSLCLSETLIYLNPQLATSLISYYNRIVRLDGFNLNENNKLYKEHLKKAKKGELAWFYKLRFGKIVRTTFYLKHNKIRIKHQLLNKKGYCGNDFIHFVQEPARKYIDGINFYQIIQENRHNDIALKERLETYIGEVFRQFSLPNSNLLHPKAWDVVPTNCIITYDNRYLFYDFEYEQNGQGLDRSYILYRILLHSCLDNKLKEFYEYFCQKFLLENKFSWCSYIESLYFKGILDYPSPKYKSKLLNFMVKVMVSFIPLASYRKKYRKKLLNYFLEKDRSLFQRYFVVNHDERSA